MRFPDSIPVSKGGLESSSLRAKKKKHMKLLHKQTSDVYSEYSGDGESGDDANPTHPESEENAADVY